MRLFRDTKVMILMAGWVSLFVGLRPLHPSWASQKRPRCRTTPRDMVQDLKNVRRDVAGSLEDQKRLADAERSTNPDIGMENRVAREMAEAASVSRNGPLERAEHPYKIAFNQRFKEETSNISSRVGTYGPDPEVVNGRAIEAPQGDVPFQIKLRQKDLDRIDINSINRTIDGVRRSDDQISQLQSQLARVNEEIRRHGLNRSRKKLRAGIEGQLTEAYRRRGYLIGEANLGDKYQQLIPELGSFRRLQEISTQSGRKLTRKQKSELDQIVLRIGKNTSNDSIEGKLFGLLYKDRKIHEFSRSKLIEQLDVYEAWKRHQNWWEELKRQIQLDGRSHQSYGPMFETLRREAEIVNEETFSLLRKINVAKQKGDFVAYQKYLIEFDVLLHRRDLIADLRFEGYLNLRKAILKESQEELARLELRISEWNRYLDPEEAQRVWKEKTAPFVSNDIVSKIKYDQKVQGPNGEWVTLRELKLQEARDQFIRERENAAKHIAALEKQLAAKKLEFSGVEYQERLQAQLTSLERAAFGNGVADIFDSAADGIATAWLRSDSAENTLQALRSDMARGGQSAERARDIYYSIYTRYDPEAAYRQAQGELRLDLIDQEELDLIRVSAEKAKLEGNPFNYRETINRLGPDDMKKQKDELFRFFQETRKYKLHHRVAHLRRRAIEVERTLKRVKAEAENQLRELRTQMNELEREIQASQSRSPRNRARKVQLKQLKDRANQLSDQVGTRANYYQNEISLLSSMERKMASQLTPEQKRKVDQALEVIRQREAEQATRRAGPPPPPPQRTRPIPRPAQRPRSTPQWRVHEEILISRTSSVSMVLKRGNIIGLSVKGRPIEGAVVQEIRSGSIRELGRNGVILKVRYPGNQGKWVTEEVVVDEEVKRTLKILEQ